MDITKILAELKKDPGFAENVGMTLIHNGTVRGWSRKDRQEVKAIRVRHDYDKIESIRQELEQNEGIYRIITEAYEGDFKPGDDVMYLIVAGDIRENVKATLAELLDRIKSEAVTKEEIFA